jgi:putative membrane protein
MSLRSYRILQALILFGLGIMFFQKFITDKLYYYINERFFWLVILAAAGLIILGAVLLESRAETQDHDHNEGHDHDHTHASGGKRWVLVIVAIPLALGYLIPANPLDANLIQSRGISNEAIFSANQGQGGIELNAPADQRTILDWIRAFNYSQDPAELQGETADVIGFVYHDPRLAEGQFLVGRLTVTCCVADAFAIGMVVEWPEAEQLKDNSWVHVRGPIQVLELDDVTLPLIVAESVKDTAPPAKPYLYP